MQHIFCSLSEIWGENYENIKPLSVFFLHLRMVGETQRVLNWFYPFSRILEQYSWRFCQLEFFFWVYVNKKTFIIVGKNYTTKNMGKRQEKNSSKVKQALSENSSIHNTHAFWVKKRLNIFNTTLRLIFSLFPFEKFLYWL